MLEDTFPYADVYYRLASNEANVTEKALEMDEARQIALQMVQQAQESGGDIPQLQEAITSQVDELVRTMQREIRNYYRSATKNPGWRCS